MLADESTYLPGTDAPVNGFGIYVQDINGQSFEDYMYEQQRTTSVVAAERGFASRPPQTSEAMIIIGGEKGVLLSGYDLHESEEWFYVPLDDGRHILHIRKTKLRDNGFDLLFDQVLSTFTFFE